MLTVLVRWIVAGRITEAAVRVSRGTLPAPGALVAVQYAAIDLEELEVGVRAAPATHGVSGAGAQLGRHLVRRANGAGDARPCTAVEELERLQATVATQSDAAAVSVRARWGYDPSARGTGSAVVAQDGRGGDEVLASGTAADGSFLGLAGREIPATRRARFANSCRCVEKLARWAVERRRRFCHKQSRHQRGTK